MSFLADPIGNISGAIHDVGKSSIGKMAEAAALAYFLGPAGEGLMGANTALGVGGGLTTLLNGGSLQDSLKSGLISARIGSLTGVGDTIGATAIPGGAPVGVGIPTPVEQIAQDMVPNANLQNAVTPTPTDLPVAPPVSSAPVTQVPGVNAPPTPAPPPIDPNAGRAFYDQLGPDGKPLSVTKSLLQSYGKAGLPTQLGIAALTAAGLKAAAKPQALNYNAPNNQQLRYFGGSVFSGPSNMYQTKAATGGLVALAKGGGVHHYDDGGDVNSTYTPQQIADYISQNNLSGDSLAAAEQQFGVTPEQVSYAQAQAAPQSPPPDVVPIDPSVVNNQPTPQPTPDRNYVADDSGNYIDSSGNFIDVSNTPGSNNIVGDGGLKTAIGQASTTPQYTSYTDQQIKDYFAQNPGANVALAEQQFNADPNQVNKVLGAVPSMSAVLQQNAAQQPSTPDNTGIASLPAAATSAAATPAPAPTPASTPVNPALVNANSSTADIASAVSALQAKGLTDNQIAQQLFNQGVIAPQVLSAVGAKPGDENYNRVENAYGQTTLTNPSVYGINPNAPVPAGLAAIDKAVTGSATATPQQAGIQAIKNAQEYNLLQTLANPNATDITNFQNGSAADKNKAIQNAVTAATDLYGGNNTQAQTAIAKLMDKWGVKPADVGAAIGVKPDTIQSLYNAVDPSGIYALKTAINNATTPTEPVVKTPSTSTGGGGGGGGSSATTPATKTTTPTTGAPTTVAPTTVAPTTPLTTPTITTTPATVMANTLTQPANNYTPGYISNSLTNPTSAPGVSGSHAFIDANGYVSQRANEVGQPLNAQGYLGNFTSVQQMKDAYTKAGGSLGDTNPTGKTYTSDAATQHILDMLSGKIPASKVPYTPTGEIFKPYYSSVMGMKENPVYTISQPTIFDPASRTYVKNPNYDSNFNATADYIGAYAPGYKGEAVPGLSQKTLDYLNQNGVSAYGKSATNQSANTTTATNTPGSAPVTVGGKSYPAGSYIAGNGHLMVPDGGQDSNGNPSYTDMGVQAAGGGLMGLAAGGMSVGHLGGYSDGGRLLRGPGDGVSDSIPATIGSTNPEPARLADGEFVVPARIVSELGNGSTEAGARQLYKMMDRIQHARRKTTGKDRVATNTNANKYLPA